MKLKFEPTKATGIKICFLLLLHLEMRVLLFPLLFSTLISFCNAASLISPLLDLQLIDDNPHLGVARNDRKLRQIGQSFNAGSSALNINCNGPDGCLGQAGSQLLTSGLGLVGSLIGGLANIPSPLNIQENPTLGQFNNFGVLLPPNGQGHHRHLQHGNRHNNRGHHHQHGQLNQGGIGHLQEEFFNSGNHNQHIISNSEGDHLLTPTGIQQPEPFFNNQDHHNGQQHFSNQALHNGQQQFGNQALHNGQQQFGNQALHKGQKPIKNQALNNGQLQHFGNQALHNGQKPHFNNQALHNGQQQHIGNQALHNGQKPHLNNPALHNGQQQHLNNQALHKGQKPHFNNQALHNGQQQHFGNQALHNGQKPHLNNQALHNGQQQHIGNQNPHFDQALQQRKLSNNHNKKITNAGGQHNEDDVINSEQPHGADEENGPEPNLFNPTQEDNFEQQGEHDELPIESDATEQNLRSISISPELGFRPQRPRPKFSSNSNDELGEGESFVVNTDEEEHVSF